MYKIIVLLFLFMCPFICIFAQDNLQDYLKDKRDNVGSVDYEMNVEGTTNRVINQLAKIAWYLSAIGLAIGVVVVVRAFSLNKPNARKLLINWFVTIITIDIAIYLIKVILNNVVG